MNGFGTGFFICGDTAQAYIKEAPHNRRAKRTNVWLVLRQAIGKLQPREQAVITLRFFEDLDAARIAEILGGSPATVRSQLSRALTQLRRHMRSAEVDAPWEVETYV